MYEIVFSDLLPTNGNLSLWGRVSVSTSFKSGSTDYAHARSGVRETNAVVDSGGADNAVIVLASTIGHTATVDELSGTIRIIDPGSTGNRTQITWHICGQDTTPLFTNWQGSGQYQTSGATDGFQLLLSDASNIITCRYTVYGYKAAL